jgi:hypothetical protein
MRPPISQHTKTMVVQQWLEGKTRDQIARDNGQSSGTVTNIITEWRKNLGYPIAEDLRELAVTLRRLRMDPSSSALGARVASMMKTLGLDEEEFHQFMSVVYKDCITLGVKRDKISYYIRELLELCENIPFSEIPDYIEQQKTRKRKLEQELQELEAREVDAKDRVDKALREEGITRHDLNFKRELWKREISMDETSQFLEALKGIKRFGYDPATVASKYHNFLEREAGKIAIEDLRRELDRLQEEVNTHSQVIKKYKELESKGFGLKELKQLANMVKEIAVANKMPPYEAIRKFIADIEEQYDEKLGFELKLASLKSDIQEKEARRAAMSNQSYWPDWSLLFSPSLGGGEQQGREKTDDKFQRTHDATTAESQQQAKTEGANAAGRVDELPSHTTNINAGTTASLNTNKNFTHESLGFEDKDDREQDELHLSDDDIANTPLRIEVAASDLDDPTNTTSKTIYTNLANESPIDDASQEQEQDKFTIYESPYTFNLEGIRETIMQAKEKQKERLEKADESAALKI